MDLKKKSGIQQLEEFEKPMCKNTLHLKHSTYYKLEDDGLIALGTGVVGEDITLEKQHPSLPTAKSSASIHRHTHAKMYPHLLKAWKVVSWIKYSSQQILKAKIS